MVVAVLLAGTVGIIQLVSLGSEMIDLSRKQTVATQIIHREIDRLHLSDWASVNALPTSATFFIYSNGQKAGQNFSCTRAVSTIKTGMKKITFTVSWKGSSGVCYSRSSETYFGKNGLYVAYQRP